MTCGARHYGHVCTRPDHPNSHRHRCLCALEWVAAHRFAQHPAKAPGVCAVCGNVPDELIHQVETTP